MAGASPRFAAAPAALRRGAPRLHLCAPCCAADARLSSHGKTQVDPNWFSTPHPVPSPPPPAVTREEAAVNDAIVRLQTKLQHSKVEPSTSTSTTSSTEQPQQ